MTDIDPKGVVERYLSAASAGDTDTIVGLYAQDAEFLPGTAGSTTIRGRDAIASHYHSHVRGVHPRFDELFWVMDGPNVFVEIVASAPGRDQPTYISDLFTITGDGHIARMAAYTRQSRDQRHPQAEVPAEERAVVGARSKDVAERYFAAASTGDTPTIIDLYADDAVFLPSPPNTAILVGQDQIRHHYSEHVASVHPRYEQLFWIADGLNVVVEIDAAVPGADVHTFVVDVFTMTEQGRITRMAAYRRDHR